MGKVFGSSGVRGCLFGRRKRDAISNSSGLLVISIIIVVVVIDRFVRLVGNVDITLSPYHNTSHQVTPYIIAVSSFFLVRAKGLMSKVHFGTRCCVINKRSFPGYSFASSFGARETHTPVSQGTPQ